MFELERDFVNTVKTCLQGLTGDLDMSVARQLDALEVIAASAKTVSARAVMIGAERCLAPAKAGTLSTAFELRTLARLAAQYEAGLLEIDIPVPVAANEPAKTERAHIEGAPLADAADKIAFEIKAADTLQTVMAFAPAAHKPALSSLMRFARGEAIIAPPCPAQKPVFLENLIAPVTSEALVCAHRAHKRVSLSYACDQIAVSGDVAPALQNLLITLCENLIEQSLRHPAVREAAGLPATGQIALTASETAHGLTLDVFCDDLAVERGDLIAGKLQKALTTYEAAGGQVKLSEGRKSGVMLCVSHANPSAAPKKQTPRTAAPAEIQTADNVLQLREAMA